MAADQLPETILRETRRIPPPAALQQSAHIAGEAALTALRSEAARNPEAYWAEAARTQLSWHKPFTKAFVAKAEEHFTWFGDGQLNASYNCLDRHLASRGDKLALLWEGEPGDERRFTYRQLHREVVRFSAVLAGLGVAAGDVVSLYLPMIPELMIAVLACSRLGAMHNVVFAGFSADALASRNHDAGAKLIITADGSYRRGKILALKSVVDQSLQLQEQMQEQRQEQMQEQAVRPGALPAAVVVVQRCSAESLGVTMQSGRDFWWHELVAAQTFDLEAAAPAWPAEQPLFLLYTSGSTGKPKGLLHTTAGYLVGAALTSRLIFDLQEDDVYWCTADIGWITGHSYVVYGPLANGATVLMYEGAPDAPDWSRFWQLIAKYRVSKFYTAPTAIRAFMRYAPAAPSQHDLSSLKVLGSVGEPINPEAWLWYHAEVGQGRCPVVDTWWQTETGVIMIAPLPGASTTKPGSACRPFPGIDAAVVDADGLEQGARQGGYLVVRKPWPSMARTIWGDHARYREQYWQKIPGCYFTGDGAQRDEDGDFWILGRIDDVINCAGHRLSTMEVESALVSHPLVTEAAVIGKPDAIKGEVIVAFVTLVQGTQGNPTLEAELSQHVVQQIGALARPATLHFTEALPKTRSGKIMRRLLRRVAQGEAAGWGDTSTLDNAGVLDRLQEDFAGAESR